MLKASNRLQDVSHRVRKRSFITIGFLIVMMGNGVVVGFSTPTLLSRFGIASSNRFGFQSARPERNFNQDLRKQQQQQQQQRSSGKLHSLPHANLAVSLDKPLYPVQSVPRSLEALQGGGLIQTIAFALCTTFVLSAVTRSKLFTGTIGSIWKLFKGRILQFMDAFKPNRVGVPMEFSPEVNDGWGVCTVRSRRRLGSTSFTQFDFDLPNSDLVLPLSLGQSITMCCLDNDDAVVKGSLYTYEPATTAKLGTFSVLVPSLGHTETVYALGEETADFVRVLKGLKAGDEIAIKPEESKLKYSGQYLPVTDMVYVAYGVGIVPVLEQLRAVLPNGASSVSTVSLVWINPDAEDFDVIAEQLEREYYKHNTKLAVACVVDNMTTNTLGDNREIEGGIPSFVPGTMAVLSGPHEVCQKAEEYLGRRGYPADCICEL